MTVLAIIGNGFDLAMGLPSSLEAFGRFVAKDDSLLFDRIERHVPVEGQWWNLEEALEYFDPNDAIEEAAQHLVGYGAEDWSDAYHHSVQHEAEEIAGALSNGLRGSLSNWVTSLDRLALHQNAVLHLPPSARFLNFNYTCTLQRAFNISDQRVFHIHGQGFRGDPVVLGHALPISDPRSVQEYGNEDDDVRIVQAAEILEETLNRSSKRSSEIIEANEAWFKSLNTVSQVFVLGHSFADVDHIYFEEVARNTMPNAEWFVSCFNTEDEKRAANLKSALGVHSERWRHFNLALWMGL